MKKITYNVLTACMPLFVLFLLFSQMEATNVVELHNRLVSVPAISTVTKDENYYDVGITMIPCSEPIVESMSITNLFNANIEVLGEFSKEAASSTFSEGCDEILSYVRDGKGSLYTRQYITTAVSLFEYFRDSAMFGTDSFVTVNSKEELNSDLSMLKFITCAKILFSILLFICSVLGFVVWRLRKIDM